MDDQIEPYAPCPCGSGKKYKFCCAAEDKANRRGKFPLFSHSEMALFWGDEEGDAEDLLKKEPDEESDGERSDADFGPGDWETKFARVEAIVGTEADGGGWDEKLFKHLQANLQLPCEVTGSEDFNWEERYVIGGWSQREYRELKKTQPSYRDRYQLLAIERDLDSRWIMFRGEDIGAKVRRISDGKIFVLGLAELKATDKKSINYQLINDYAVWFVNNR
jgi:hypothetical protein